MTAAQDGQPSGPAHAAAAPDTQRAGSRWLAGIPRHVGRARTSTVVLSVLFLAIGTLYLNVHPTDAQTTPGGGVVAPQPAPATSRSRVRTTTPTTTSSVPATATSSVPTPSTGPTVAPTTTEPRVMPSSPAPATSSAPVLPTAGSGSAAPTS